MIIVTNKRVDHGKAQDYNIDMSKTEIVEHQGKPKQKQGPSKNREMTKARRRKIIEAVLDGKDPAKVAESLGYSPKTAGIQATQILSNPLVKRSFVSILEQRGLTDDFLADKALELMSAETPHFFSKDGKVEDTRMTPAHETRRKTLELVGKFKGHLKDDKGSGDINVGLMQMVVNVVNNGGE